MKKAFTLIELLAVISILGILGLIATVTVSNNIKESNQKAYDINIGFIIDGAKSWAGKNVFSLPEKDGEYVTLTLGQLKKEGFVKDDITNPLTKEPFNDNLQVKITKGKDNYDYQIIE